VVTTSIVGRDINSLYAETIIPIFSSLELNLAVRYDDYSDFGGTTNPKASIAWRPMDNLLLRASYGTGFRAPDMQELFGNQSESFPSAIDHVGCANGVSPCNAAQYRSFFGGNPDLDAETSDSFTVGVVWNITDNFSFEVDYYNIQFENKISTLGLQRMFNLERDGFTNTVTRNPDGTVNQVSLTQLNLSGDETDGIDVISNYSLNTDNAGMFNFQFQWSHVLSFDQEAVPGDGFVDILDSHGVPEDRVNLNINWSLGNFQASWLASYIGANGKADEIECPDGNLCQNDSWLTHDIQVAYNLPWNAEIALGARNAFDTSPPFNGFVYGWQPMDFSLYDAQGRITYLRYKQNF